MTIKQAIEIAIAAGMTTFTIHHFGYKGFTYEQNLDTIYNFIKGYENDLVVTIYFGSAYKEGGIYSRPTHCEIVFRGANENLPS